MYLSQQDDNLQKEFVVLLAEDIVEENLKLGVTAFGNSPDAVNLWIGDERMRLIFRLLHFL